MFTCYVYTKRIRNKYYYLLIPQEEGGWEPMMWELSHFIRFCTNTDYNDSLRTTFTWKDVTCPHCLVKGKPEVDTGFKFAWRPSKSS